MIKKNLNPMQAITLICRFAPLVLLTKLALDEIIKEPQTNKRRHFFDMDGVLSTFIPSASEEEINSPGYFISLKPLQNNIDALNYLKECGEDVYILSKVLSDAARKEKDEWLNKNHVNIPKEKRIFVRIDEDKAKYVKDITKDDFLYDDFSENLVKWENAGGTAVKILNGINGKGEKFKGARIYVKEPSQLSRFVGAV